MKFVLVNDEPRTISSDLLSKLGFKKCHHEKHRSEMWKGYPSDYGYPDGGCISGIKVIPVNHRIYTQAEVFPNGELVFIGESRKPYQENQ